MTDKRFTLAKIAQMAMDAYYRDYKHDDEFFDMPHFKFLACATWAKIMNDTFEADKMRNKDTDGFSYVNLSGPWIFSEDLDIKEDKAAGKKYIETTMPLFCFDTDAICSSIHSILKPAGVKCGDIMRLSNKDIWKIDYLPITNDIYFYQLGERIWLPNLTCDPGKLTVNYVPALMPDNDKCSMPETMVMGIVTTVLQVMFGAKNETAIVKTANNSNINVSPGTELAPEQVKNLKQ